MVSKSIFKHQDIRTFLKSLVFSAFFALLRQKTVEIIKIYVIIKLNTTVPCEYRYRAGGTAMDIWNKLYRAALKVQNPRVVSPFIEAGGVAAAIESETGNIYVGVCIDTCSSLGMCAERAAIASMLTHGESRIRRVVAVMSNGKVGSPCGACREFMMQLDKDSSDIEILLDIETKSTTPLGALCPDWWGKTRFE